MTQLTPGIYRHYKNKDYKVVGLAMHTENDEPMVMYQALYNCPDLAETYGDKPWFVRPLSSFTESVTLDDETVPRFKLIEPKL